MAGSHDLATKLAEMNLPASGYIGNPQTGKIYAWGTTVPTGTTAGFLPGCIFIDTDASTGALVWLNEGSVTSCNFDAMELAAADVPIVDAGGLITATTVEAAFAEAFTHIQTAQAYLNLPIGAWTLDDGTAIAAFSDGDSETPGWHAGDETFGIRWNNKATHDKISASVPIPPDLDASKDVIVHFMAAKTGNDGSDAVTWDLEAFNNADAALYDADTDFGGASSAMTAAAAAKTCQEETRTLASANVAASPCVLTLTVQPTNTTLATDDVILIGVWLEYTRKTLTA